VRFSYIKDRRKFGPGEIGPINAARFAQVLEYNRGNIGSLGDSAVTV
jgi:hypothetical protein